MSIFDPSGAFIYEKSDQEKGQVIQSKPYDQFNGARCRDYREIKEGIKYLESLGYHIFPPRKPFPHMQKYLATRTVGNIKTDLTATGSAFAHWELSIFSDILKEMLHGLHYREDVRSFKVTVELLNIFTGGKYTTENTDYYSDLTLTQRLPDDTFISDITSHASSAYDMYQLITPYNHAACNNWYCLYFGSPQWTYENYQIGRGWYEDSVLDISSWEGLEYMKYIEDEDYTEWNPVIYSTAISPEGPDTIWKIEQMAFVAFLKLEATYVHDE